MTSRCPQSCSRSYLLTPYHLHGTTSPNNSPRITRNPLKKDITVPQFIGECHEEYQRHQKCGTDSTKTAYAGPCRPLTQCLSNSNASTGQNQKKTCCTHCGRTNHKIENCYHILKPKCSYCKKLGHEEALCKTKKKTSHPHNKDKIVTEALASPQEANATLDYDDYDDKEAETLTALNANSFNEPILFDDDMYLANSTVNEASHMYDWLADSGSIHHITNRHELFSSYKPTPQAIVHGVGGKIIQVVGRGTILLTTQYGTRTRVLRLENVNFIPITKFNIFTLRRWDDKGRRYQATKGTLTLYNRDDVPILKGSRINLHIYKFWLQPADATKIINSKHFTFSSHEPQQTWETWHRHFGHIR